MPRDGRMKPVAEFIERHERFLVVGHVMPDGDSIGSSIALRDMLASIGKEAAVLMPDPLPVHYDFLVRGNAIFEWSAVDVGFLDGWDALFVLDCSGWARLGELGHSLRDRQYDVACLDHHASHEPFADVRVVDDTSPATAALVYELIEEEMGLPLRESSAEALFVGLMTDTGSFTHGNATPTAFRIAARLVERGATPQKIADLVRGRYSVQSLGFLREGLGLVRTEGDGRVGWLAIPHRLFRAYGATIEDALPMMKFVRGITGVCLSILLYEDEPESVKVSFRSRGNIDVNCLAQCFGGGGHRSAAGALLLCPLSEAEERILAEAVPAVATKRE